MGYTTDFDGTFQLNKKLDAETHTFLNKLNETRRMKRKGLDPKYGIDGEFYVDGGGFMGQGSDDSNIVDHNSPPKTQPGLWNQWRPTDDGMGIEWDGNEKFYNYIEWLQYLIDNVLEPRGYYLNGVVKWIGEDRNDMGAIEVTKNRIKILKGKISYVNQG